MAKYIVLEDFEVGYFKPPLTTQQVKIFPKGTIVDAVLYPDTSLKTKLDGSKPSGAEGEILIPLVIDKVKRIDEGKAIVSTDRSEKIKKWAMFGAGAALLLWFIYGRKKKEVKTLSGIGGTSKKKKPEVYEFVVPEWSLPYLINNDPSGLTEDEIKKVDKFAEEVYKLTKSDISMGSGWDGEPYFKWRNDIDGSLGANVYDVEVVKRK